MNGLPPGRALMIIGAMKSGTSTLYSVLSQHPKICTCSVKEPEFFSTNQGHEVDAARYADLFDFDSGDYSYYMEGSTGYTKFPYELGVPDRIHEYGLKPRFIYIVRNPLDRIVSDYNFAQLNDKPWAQPDILNPPSIFKSMYHLQLREFMRAYPDRSRYFIADFDDLTDSPSRLANNILSWLGLDPIEVGTPTIVNKTPTPSRIEHMLRNQGVQNLYNKLPLAPAMFSALKRVLRRVDRSAKRELTGDERDRAMRWLRSDMNRFSSDFDFPIEKWGFHGSPTSRE